MAEQGQVVPAYLASAPAALVELVFLLQRKGKYRVQNHGFELEEIVRLGKRGDDDLIEAGISTPEERAKWLLAGYKELLASGHKAAPVEYICDRACGLYVKSIRAAAREANRPKLDAPTIKTDVAAIRAEREATEAEMRASTSNPWSKYNAG